MFIPCCLFLPYTQSYLLSPQCCYCFHQCTDQCYSYHYLHVHRVLFVFARTARRMRYRSCCRFTRSASRAGRAGTGTPGAPSCGGASPRTSRSCSVHCSRPSRYSRSSQCSTTGVTKPVVCVILCGMVHIKEPLLLIDNSILCGGSRFPFSLSEWFVTICLMPYNPR